MRRCVTTIVLISVLLIAGTSLALRSGQRPAPPREDLVGLHAPDFDAVTVSGGTVSSRDLRGKVAIVNIWATWCEPCREELPRLEREIWVPRKKDVVVLAIARGETEARIREFNKTAGLTFLLVPDRDRRLTRMFGGADAIPRTYVIGRDGRIVHQTIGYTPASFNQLLAVVRAAVRRAG